MTEIDEDGNVVDQSGSVDEARLEIFRRKSWVVDCSADHLPKPPTAEAADEKQLSVRCLRAREPIKKRDQYKNVIPLRIENPSSERILIRRIAAELDIGRVCNRTDKAPFLMRFYRLNVEVEPKSFAQIDIHVALLEPEVVSRAVVAFDTVKLPSDGN